MAFCTYCGQQFHRNEHLERHLLSHTNVKPYKCSVCHVSFSRRDVLQKHSVIHGDETQQSATSLSGGANPLAGRAGPRTQKACLNCAKMKAKCDSSFPCNRCQLKNLGCDRRQPKTRTRRAANSTPTNANSNSAEENSPVDSVAATMNDQIAEVIPSHMPSSNLEGEPSINHPHYTPRSELQPGSVQQRNASEQGGNQMFDNCGPYLSPPGFDGTIFSPDRRIVSFGTPSLVNWETSDQPVLPRSSNTGGSIMNEMNLMDSENGNLAGDRTTHKPQATAGSRSSVSGQPFLQNRSTDDYRWDYCSPSNIVEAPDHASIIEAQNYWTAFRCNPLQNVANCPKTAGILLENLGHMPEVDNLWGWLNMNLDVPSPGITGLGNLASLPLDERMRDKLSAIAQTFLQKALEIHRLDNADQPSVYPSPRTDKSLGFLILPPSATLEHFLREYMRLFEPFYSLIPTGTLDPNTLMNHDNNKVSTLLILLMIAQGAMSDPTGEARRLSGGLTEVCRISLFDTIEKDISMCKHPLLIHCALLFVIQAAWSGDKWLMDIAMGQRGIYIAMVRHDGLLESEMPGGEDTLQADNWESAWTYWLEREREIRLTYAWVIVDQELCLFRDAIPSISISELDSPLPGPENLWLASNAASWQEILCQQGAISNDSSTSLVPKVQMSLRTLFQFFLENEIERRGVPLTPFTLRLLLYPLQSLVQSYRHLLSCLADGNNMRSSPITRKSTLLRLEEIQSLLHRWLGLYRTCVSSLVQSNLPSMNAALITYHLISLNAVTSFTEIEASARKGLSDFVLRSNSHLMDRCLQGVDEAVLHAGQIMYLLRTLEKKARPPWWPAALYRAALILWASSVFASGQSPRWQVSASNFVIDVELHDDEVEGYLRGAASRPALTGKSGEVVYLENPTAVLETSLRIFGEGTATRFSEGIRRRLKRFVEERRALA